MARRSIPIEERIAAQEQEVLKAKKKFEEESDKLKDLYRKRDEGRKKELLEAVARSSRSFEEIIAFVQSDSDENE
jgi:hypothetical protein